MRQGYCGRRLIDVKMRSRPVDVKMRSFVQSMLVGANKRGKRRKNILLIINIQKYVRTPVTPTAIFCDLVGGGWFDEPAANKRC